MVKKPLRKAKKRAYHHGDLERALVDTAVRLIQEEGVQALTLRGVGARLGVSRTALYRHFDDKQALLARVASEGFKRFHDALAEAAARAEAGGKDPMPAMAAAYARFARSHPSHYQTMFSGVLTDGDRNDGPTHRSAPTELQRHGEAAFNVLLTAIRRGQEQGRVRAGDPLELAEITWALSHGIAALGMAQQLPCAPSKLEALAVRGWTILYEGMSR
jgi:AcrR family transcriptional regulator